MSPEEDVVAEGEDTPDEEEDDGAGFQFDKGAIEEILMKAKADAEKAQAGKDKSAADAETLDETSSQTEAKTKDGNRHDEL